MSELASRPVIRVPEHVTHIIETMSGFTAPWALGGGWAVDNWLGEVTREHVDVDIIVFGDDHQALFEHLTGWQLAHHHKLPDDGNEIWQGQRLYMPNHIHGRVECGEPLPEEGALWQEQGWCLDVMFNERAGNEWVMMREPLVSLAVDRCFRATALAPTVTPEVLLFFKALDMRSHDRADFERLSPLLDTEGRDWLRDALTRVGHPWLPRLSS